MENSQDSQSKYRQKWCFDQKSDDSNVTNLDESFSITKFNLISLYRFNYGMFWGVLVGTIAIASAAIGAALTTFPLINSIILSKLDQNEITTKLTPNSVEIETIIPASLTQPLDILVVEIPSNIQGFRDLSHTVANSIENISLWQFDPQQKLVKITIIPSNSPILIPELGWITIEDADIYGGIPLVSQTINQIVDGVTVDNYIHTSSISQSSQSLTMAERDLTKSGCQSFELGVKPYVNAVKKCTINSNQLKHPQSTINSLRDSIVATLSPGLNNQNLSEISTAIPTSAKYLETDLSQSQMLALANFIGAIPENNFQVSLLPEDLQPKQQLIGKSSFDSLTLKDRSKKKTQSLTANNSHSLSLSDNKNSHPFHNMAIAIQNTTNRPELAARAIAYLRKRNFHNVYLVHYLPLKLDKTEIILPQTKIRTANYLRQTLGFGRLKLNQDNSQEAIVIRIGEDASYLTLEDSFVR